MVCDLQNLVVKDVETSTLLSLRPLALGEAGCHVSRAHK